MSDEEEDTPPVRAAVAHDESERFTRIEMHIGSLNSSRRTFRRVLWLAIPALLGALVTAVLYVADRIASGSERVGATAAELRALHDDVRRVEQDLRDIRREKDRIP